MIIKDLNHLHFFGRLLLSALLALNMAVVNAAEHVHSHAETFSNPDAVAPVDDNWKNKPLKYDEQYKDADLVVSLGQQSHPILKQLMADYATKHNLKIVLLHGTCGINSGRLLRKKVDIGAFCCPPGKNDRFPGMTFHSLGISPIALIVHKSNPVKNVSSKRAREIFQGKIARWSAIEGASPVLKGLIKPVGRLHCKIRPGHWRSLLKNENQFSPRLFEVGVISDMISQVARNANAIGWEVPIMVKVYKEKGDVRMLSIDGYSPANLDNVLTGRYPLYRSYSLTTWDSATGVKKKQVHALVQYLRNHMEKVHSEVDFVTPAQLRKAGWKFKGEELIGEPEDFK